jgi:hypothetical protein
MASTIELPTADADDDVVFNADWKFKDTDTGESLVGEAIELGSCAVAVDNPNSLFSLNPVLVHQPWLRPNHLDADD